MIIHIEVISENIYDNIILKGESFYDIQNQIYCRYMTSLDNQEWYFNDNFIDSTFKLEQGNYTVYFFGDYISLTINNKNKIKTLPYLSTDLKICELKNILSIKDNIYLNNQMLISNKKLSDYNIKSNDILNIKNKLQIVKL